MIKKIKLNNKFHIMQGSKKKIELKIVFLLYLCSLTIGFCRKKVIDSIDNNN